MRFFKIVTNIGNACVMTFSNKLNGYIAQLLPQVPGDFKDKRGQSQFNHLS